MEENLSKITAIIGSMEISPSEVDTVLWLSEQNQERVDDICRIMSFLKDYTVETFKKYTVTYKDGYQAGTYYFNTLDDANEFAMQKWRSIVNEPEHHIYVGISTSVSINEKGEYYSNSLDLIFPIGAFDSSEVGLFRKTVSYQIFEAI